MRRVFADAGYWIALLNPRDSLHAKAREVSVLVQRARTVTSEMVLTEVLNAFASKGEHCATPRARSSTTSGIARTRKSSP